MGLGDFLKRFEVPQPLKENPADITRVIHRFLHELHEGDRLTPEQARRRIEENVIEIEMYGQHSSNGLLITENGYFLTAYHCVAEDVRSALTVRAHNDSIYPLAEVCYALPRLDLALAKAVIPAEPKSIHHAFYGDDFEQLHTALAQL